MSEERVEYGTTDVQVIQRDIAPVVAQAEMLQIVTPQDYAAAAEALKANKGLQAKADELFVAPWRNAKSVAEANRKKWDDMLLAPLRRAESILKDKQLAWSQEQERIRQAEQARLQAIADEKARKEREKAESAARLQREKEAAARAEQERQERLAAQARNEVERQKAAAAAEAARKAAEAAAAKAEVKEDTAAAVAAPGIEVASVRPVVAGQRISRTWKALVVDAALVPREWMVVNQQALDAFARSTKGAVPVAGVRFESVDTLASASK